MSEEAKFRILVTAFDYRPRLGGVATFAYELSRAMASRPGIEVKVIAPEEEGDRQFDATSGVPTVRARLSKKGMEAVLPMTAILSREIMRWRPNAILNTLWLPGGMATLMNLPLLRAAGVPYFVMAHGVEVLEARSSLRKRVRAIFSPTKKMVFQRAEGVFVNSEFTAGLVKKECAVEPSRIRVTHTGVDCRDFFPEPPAADLLEKYGLQGKRVLLTVSRLMDYKGIDRAIAALRHVIPRCPDVRYLICGEGPDRARLEAIAQHYRVTEQVIFAGAVPFQRLRDHYNLSDALVLLTRDDWETPNVEGYGIVFLEAAACGKPSIGGRSGGIPDAVLDGRTGWLVDPCDDRAIASTMIEALESPDERKQRGQAALERVCSELTWQNAADRVLSEVRSRVRN